MTEPVSGDIIRVRSGSIWHYGIYVSDQEVIQFGANPATEGMVLNLDVAVISGNIDNFLLEGFLEVAVFDKKELKKKKSPADIVKIARSRIGEKGYHILYNNCEHFVNECAFGEHKCEQVDSIRMMFRSLPILDVYAAVIPDKIKIETVYPKQRNTEINGCKNERVKIEKYYVWKLLEQAVSKTFGLKFSDIDFKKNKNGKWECKDFCFSLSHSNGIVAVALSKTPVGVDVEALNSIKSNKLQNRVLSPDELDKFNDIRDENEKKLFILEMWTKKECEFKRFGGESFSPALIDASYAKTLQFEHNGGIYMISVANDNVEKLRFHGIDQTKL